MAPRYHVRLKDVAGVLVADITDWYSLSFTHRVNGIDSHELQIDGDIPNVDLFELDGQVEVWRRDIAEGIDWYLEYEGFHRTPVRQTTEDGRSLYTSVGKGYDHLLSRRIILYASGSAQADKAAVGETVMKEFVDENAGPGSTSPPRLLSAGVMAGLAIQADGAVGAAWTGARAYRNLFDIIAEVAKESGVDFGIVGTGAALFEFQAKLSPWGDDRTTTGLDPATGLNAAGNAPVVFSLDYGNMEVPRYALNRGQEINAVIALGQGQAADRTLVERTDAVAIAESTWNRMESSRQANMESTVAGLQSIGDEVLEALQAKETFSFQALQIPSTLYGRNYFLGDLVTARYKTIERNKKIVGITVTVREGNEDIGVELSDVPLG